MQYMILYYPMNHNRSIIECTKLFKCFDEITDFCEIASVPINKYIPLLLNLLEYQIGCKYALLLLR